MQLTERNKYSTKTEAREPWNSKVVLPPSDLKWRLDLQQKLNLLKLRESLPFPSQTEHYT